MEKLKEILKENRKLRLEFGKSNKRLKEIIDKCNALNVGLNKCWLCGKEGEKTTHHLNPKKNGGLREDNTIILCKKCHFAIEILKDFVDYLYNEQDLELKKTLKLLKNIEKLE